MEATQELINSCTQQPIKFYDCIESFFECASACWISADAFLNEKNPNELTLCVEHCFTTAEVCAATAKILISNADMNPTVVSQLKRCIEACRTTMNECLKYTQHHEHAIICLNCCEQCIKVCENYAQLEIVACP